MDEILFEFKGHIKVDDEGPLDSVFAGGNVEFVLKIFDEVIFSIVEAKATELEQGKAQLTLELYGMC